MKRLSENTTFRDQAFLQGTFNSGIEFLDLGKKHQEIDVIIKLHGQVPADAGIRESYAAKLQERYKMQEHIMFPRKKSEKTTNTDPSALSRPLVQPSVVLDLNTRESTPPSGAQNVPAIHTTAPPAWLTVQDAITVVQLGRRKGTRNRDRLPWGW
jgi:hypothetical protein